MKTIYYYNHKGLPQVASYNVQNNTQTLEDSCGRKQAKIRTDKSIVRKYEWYGEPNCNKRMSLIVTQPINGMKGEFEIYEKVPNRGSLNNLKSNSLLKGIMNEHGDVVEITKNVKFLVEMLVHGDGYPNSIRRIANKCFKHLKVIP